MATTIDIAAIIAAEAMTITSLPLSAFTTKRIKAIIIGKKIRKRIVPI